MIAELGHMALILAPIAALFQSTLPLWGAAKGHRGLMALAPAASQAQFLFTALAFGCLTFVYVVSDFSVANVAANSHSAKPLLYKITGVWGNHEGSMLLWVLILSGFGACLGSFGHNLPPSLKARALAVQGLIGLGFFAFILITSNPFARLSPVPINGNGLNPVLQDPGLAFHPPFLYLGYVGFSVAFSLAVAALIEGRVDAAWARWVRPWTLAAWSFLTMGIALGSWWAYYELGWGGWWFWDPVENASFIPWLVGTALLHSAIVVEKREALKSWTVLLAILTFSLSLLGTFLVRSGVLTSVHAFATDPERGIFILMLLTLTVGGSLALYAVRAPQLRSTGFFRPVSREGAIVLNNLLMATAAGLVLLGTLYPLILDLFGKKISVGAEYFNLTFVPFMIPVLLAMAVAPLLSWKRGSMTTALGKLKVAAATFALAAGLSLVLFSWRDVMAALGIGLAVWVFAGSVSEWAERIKLLRVPLAESWRRARNLPRAAYGMSIAHAATGVMVAGITVSGAFQIEKVQYMRLGDQVTVGDYQLTLKKVQDVPGKNYLARRAHFTVTTKSGLSASLYPEKRVYPVQRSTTTEAAIRTTLLSDLYVVLGDADGKGGWATRIYLNPLVPWIWGGAILMFFGGMISLSDRRHRVGAPRRSRRVPQPVAAKG